ncbi:MAG: hypothetical protein P3W94_011160 [Paracoccus sp. (in: a-proteobacteria)]|nr:hypothetical protein [Paracoccus sp. (in: a-proteobacteria)]
MERLSGDLRQPFHGDPVIVKPHPRAIPASAAAGANLSINPTGNIFVNQSAAFSDFHVTGANPAGNACLTDTGFVAPRFTRAMWQRQIT